MRGSGVPRVPSDLVLRAAVDDRLDQWAPLTLAVAPGGFGKTTALASWVRRRIDVESVRIAWVEAERDATPAQVWQDVARRLDIDVRRGEDPAAALDRGLEQAGLTLVVLDNLERADPSLLLMAARLAHRHDNLHVLAATRQHSDLAFLRRLVDVVVIDRDDLRFTPAGVVQLARLRGLTYDEAALKDWFAPIDGWPTVVHHGIHLIREAALADAAQVDVLAGAQRRLHRELRTYLSHRFDPDLLRLAARAAHVPALTASLARSLTDHPDPDALVAELLQTGLAREVEGGARQRFTVVDYVRPALRSLSDVWAPREREQLLRRMVEEASAEHRWGDVFRLALELDEPSLLLDRFAAGGMFAFFDTPLMTEVIQRIPAGAFASRPDAQLALLACRIWAGEQVAWPVTMDRSVFALDPAASATDRAARAMMEMCLARMAGDPAAAGRLAVTVAALGKEIARDAEVPGLRMLATLWFQVGFTRFLAGDSEGAVEAARTALQWISFDPTHQIGRAAHDLLAVVLTTMGDVVAAREYLTVPVGFTPAPGVPGQQTLALLARLGVAVEELRGGDAVRLAAELDEHPAGDLWPLVLKARAHVELLWGDPATVLPAVQQARDDLTAPPTPGTVAHFVVQSFEVAGHLALGQGPLVHRALADADARVPRVVVHRAQLAVLEGRDEDALVEVLPEGAGPRDRTALALLQAGAQARLGWAETSPTRADRAARLLRRYQTWTAVAALPASLQRALVDRGDDLAGLLATRPVLPSWVPDRIDAITLFPRELVVLDCLLQGLTVEQAALELVVSPNTVKSQVRTIYRKLGATSRQEALTRARMLGLDVAAHAARQG